MESWDSGRHGVCGRDGASWHSVRASRRDRVEAVSKHVASSTWLRAPSPGLGQGESPVFVGSQWTGRCESKVPCRQGLSKWRLRAREEFPSAAPWESCHLHCQLEDGSRSICAPCAFGLGRMPYRSSLKWVKRTMKSFHSVLSQRSSAVVRHQHRLHVPEHCRLLSLLNTFDQAKLIAVPTFKDFCLELRCCWALLVQLVVSATSSRQFLLQGRPAWGFNWRGKISKHSCSRAGLSLVSFFYLTLIFFMVHLLAFSGWLSAFIVTFGQRKSSEHRLPIQLCQFEHVPLSVSSFYQLCIHSLYCSILNWNLLILYIYYSL